jgi:hypothetical protein
MDAAHYYSHEITPFIKDIVPVLWEVLKGSHFDTKTKMQCISALGEVCMVSDLDFT